MIVRNCKFIISLFFKKLNLFLTNFFFSRISLNKLSISFCADEFFLELNNQMIISISNIQEQRIPSSARQNKSKTNNERTVRFHSPSFTISPLPYFINYSHFDHLWKKNFTREIIKWTHSIYLFSHSLFYY